MLPPDAGRECAKGRHPHFPVGRKAGTHNPYREIDLHSTTARVQQPIRKLLDTIAYCRIAQSARSIRLQSPASVRPPKTARGTTREPCAGIAATPAHRREAS